MALELKFKYEINSDRTLLIITDQTGEGDTGWGGLNPNRSELGLYTYVSYQPYNKDLEILPSINDNFSYNELFLNDYESSFQFSYTKDGWYRMLMVAMTPEQYNALENPEDLINNNNYISVFAQDVLMVNLLIQRNCLLENYFECLQCNSCKCDNTKEELLKLNLGIQATDYRFHSQKEFEAQKMLETLSKQYKCCK